MAAGAREDFLQVKLILVQSGATSSAQPICSGGCLLMTLSEQSSCARVCPLLDDIVAKVSNRGTTIFPPEDKTGRDRRLIWPQAYYRSRR